MAGRDVNPRSRFAGRVALITGAGSGLGREMARVLARAGARVAAIDCREEGVAALAGELASGQAAWAVADVTDRDGLRGAVERLEGELGPVELLVANAGIGRALTALDYNAEDFEAQVRVNLIGVSNSLGAVLPGMVSRRQGHVAAISSLASYRGMPRLGGYCAAKSGVNALLESLRMELEPVGVAVSIICPGWVRTPLTEPLDLPPRTLLSVGEAAGQIVGALERRERFYAFPPRMARQMRLLRWLPSGTSDSLLRRALGKIRLKRRAEG